MNIEEEFLTFDKNDNSFPINKDYISIFSILKSSFDTEIHHEIKSKILEIEKEGYFNDHGVDHIKMVVDRISKIITNFKSIEKDFKLTPYETFILLIAANLHDAGHLIASREEHAIKGKELLSRFDKTKSLLDTNERRIIGDIAKSHGGKDDPIGKLLHEDHLSGKKIRPRLLAAILRLADELAEDKTRASRFLLRLKDQGKEDSNISIDKFSEIYHRFSESIDSVLLEGNVINIAFCVNSKQLVKTFGKKINKIITKHYLLDEIFERCLKTFKETLYCNRFFPANTRFTKLIVKIYLLNEYDEYIITPINFELEENGYPMLNIQDIYSLCGKELNTTEGKKITGKYIASIINKKNKAHEKSI
jgi:hypothetical protein